MEGNEVAHIQYIALFLPYVAPLLTAVLGIWLGSFLTHRANRKAKVDSNRWQMKQDVFSRALKAVDGLWSSWPDWSDGQPTPQDRPEIEEIREIYNLLSLTCKKEKVIESFNRCLRVSEGGDVTQSLGMDEIQNLRAAMRAELDFERMYLSRDLSWIVRVQ